MKTLDSAHASGAPATSSTANSTASAADAAERLADLAPGRTARVATVHGEDAIASRLRDLGFWPGTTVVVCHRAPLGDPTVYSLRGQTLALRREEAARVETQTDPGDGAPR